jgi:hypothetical protein
VQRTYDPWSLVDVLTAAKEKLPSINNDNIDDNLNIIHNNNNDKNDNNNNNNNNNNNDNSDNDNNNNNNNNNDNDINMNKKNINNTNNNSNINRNNKMNKFYDLIIVDCLYNVISPYVAIGGAVSTGVLGIHVCVY